MTIRHPLAARDVVNQLTVAVTIIDAAMATTLVLAEVISATRSTTTPHSGSRYDAVAHASQTNSELSKARKAIVTACGAIHDDKRRLIFGVDD